MSKRFRSSSRLRDVAAMLPSLSPTSIARARSRPRFERYWSTSASGALAAQRASTCGWISPSRVGRSRNKGGFLGLADQAAAEASWALVPKLAFWISSSVRTVSAADGPLDERPPRFGTRQQGLIAYRLENT